MPGTETASPSGRSMTWTYIGALVVEALVLIALWVISRTFA